ncbi:major facilitator superfamily domain-containing protein [Thelonectria olida]|uniref:Major facilitator superfamily domain-containing protein n=1 Tax=Thelonectria olida TaxID=1576542 RepID=A0A9P8WL10_9HYPO|nr:major facilitator superfamily domain-containing protein [Thelonectria olida]
MDTHDSSDIKPAQNDDTLTKLISPVPTTASSTVGAELQGHLYDPVSDIPAPDGGLRAWLVVFGGFINFATAFGLMNAFGSFQSYYKTHTLLHQPVYVVTWVGSVQLFLLFVSGLFIGPAYDRFGARRIMIPGAFLYLTSFICTSFAHHYWHILLSQGFLFGIRNAMLYYPTAGAIAEWFDKKRGFALGIAISGSSIGGIVWPLIVEKIFCKMGFAWTNRILAFACVCPLLVSCGLVKEPENTSRHDTHGPKLKLPRKIFKQICQFQFILFCASQFFIVMGMLIPFNWMALYAQSQGINSAMANNLFAICYAGSTVGRMVSGWAADRLGRFNILTLITVIASVLIFTWVKVDTYYAQIIWVAAFGLFSGGLVPLGSACVAQITDMNYIGLRIGVMMAFCAPGSLTGNPVSGLIQVHLGWRGVHFFAASMVMMGAVLTFWARMLGAGGRKVIA